MTPQLRRLESKDFEVYRLIRLEALSLEPGSYCSSYQREAAFTNEQWQAR